MQKYEINKYSVDHIRGWIASKEVVIPEIQRPFVWKATQVRDLIDSLYNGYPVGYLIVSRSHDVKLKDGSYSKGQRILIDGQQRVTALMTAILGMKVLDEQYKRKRSSRLHIIPSLEKTRAHLRFRTNRTSRARSGSKTSPSSLDLASTVSSSSWNTAPKTRTSTRPFSAIKSKISSLCLARKSVSSSFLPIWTLIQSPKSSSESTPREPF